MYFKNKTKQIFKKNAERRQLSQYQKDDDQDEYQSLSQYPTLTWDQFFTPFKLSLTFNQPADLSDNKLAWICNLPALSNAVRSIFLTIRKGTFMRRYQLHQIAPKAIHLCCDGVKGYINKNGVYTTRIARFGAVSISYQEQELQNGDINTFQLITYKLEADTWIEIPNEVRVLKMRVFEDQGQQASMLPLRSPISFQAVIGRRIQRNLMLEP